MSHARPAAFEDAGGGPPLLALKSLAVFVGFLPSFVRKVVSIRLFLSGLGVLEEEWDGTGRVGGGEYGSGEATGVMFRLLVDLIFGESVPKGFGAGR